MKKTFTNQTNPAMAFISAQEPPADQTKETPTAPRKQPTAPARAPEGYKIAPEYVEVKSRRVQLVFRPSLYEAVKEKAEARGQSVNDFISTILAEAIQQED